MRGIPTGTGGTPLEAIDPVGLACTGWSDGSGLETGVYCDGDNDPGGGLGGAAGPGGKSGRNFCTEAVSGGRFSAADDCRPGSGTGGGGGGDLGFGPTDPVRPPAAEQPAAQRPSFLDCVNKSDDELNPANLIGLGDSPLARGVLGGPFSTGLSALGAIFHQDPPAEAIAGTIGQAVPFVAQAAAGITQDPTWSAYPAITTLTDAPAIAVYSLPVRSIGAGLAAFFEKINPLAIAIDLTSVGISAVGCSAFE